ncbi:UDP-N-acetylmuramoyl-L-alanyl-D-glutamate--2,6-diaminopimelate ligase [Candidatus Fermentibacterales bacterium]|nr:UDP-N-acetylmuramoyl-L-alanyl-D-glutamate--2,6-diaminopimelate ligase [Candidatus Fermentibacterales bacterium]
MKLRDLLRSLECLESCPAGLDEVEVTGISYDSRNVAEGDLFVAISGFRSDGHDYIERAFEAGAVAAMAERPVESSGPVLVCPGVSNRRTLARLSAEFYGRPWEALTVVGVTGTNGKTSTAHMIRWMLERGGTRTGMMGTVGHLVAGHRMPPGVTTPESLEVSRFMAMMRDNGDSACVMEVSSHSLALDRVDEVRFDVAVFTNITQDHLDFHADMDDYLATKLKIFDLLKADGRKIVGQYAEGGSPKVRDSVTFGPGEDCTYVISNVETDLTGSRFRISGPIEQTEVELATPGMFNVFNAAGALATVAELGECLSSSARALQGFRGVPGRFERVDAGQPFLVAVDYAHTPDALERVLEQARELTRERLIVVFGCGGDRDRTKRPLMGGIAARIADICVVTSDNPRTEDPGGIIADILEGIGGAEDGRSLVVEPDRKKAIDMAIGEARRGDAVIIAGKGHEDYQVIGTEKVHFDDREIARSALEGCGNE